MVLPLAADILQHKMSDTEESEDTLSHWGKKGMKWGVRKNPKKSSVKVTSETSGKSAEIKINPRKTTVDLASGTISTSSRKEAKKISSQVKKNEIKLMSDEELSKRIKRIKMEQELTKLTAAQMSPGQRVVREVIASAGKRAMQDVANNQADRLSQMIISGAVKGVVSGTAKAALGSAGPRHRA